MASVKDDRGYNQGFRLNKATEVRMQRRANWMMEKMDAASDKAILEIGCGTGEVSYWIALKSGKRVLGTDLCVPFINDAKIKYVLPNLTYDVLNFNEIESFKSQRFDYIIGNGILHHLYYNLDAALASLRLLLKEGGKIIFMEPNIVNPYCALIFKVPFMRTAAHLEPDEMAFSSAFIQQKLEKAEFKNIEVEYRDFLLPGLPRFLIWPSIVIGNALEKIPVVNKISQSLFIVAQKQ